MSTETNKLSLNLSSSVGFFDSGSPGLILRKAGGSGHGGASEIFCATNVPISPGVSGTKEDATAICYINGVPADGVCPI